MKKVLGIFAHPDDEILWGFPMFQNPNIEKSLLTISDNHPGYDYHAKVALKQVCLAADISLIGCVGLPSEFYRVHTRYRPFTLMTEVVPTIRNHIKGAITTTLPDCIITHNPFGEYGHGDHRLIFNIISCLPEADKIDIVFTDACQWNKTHLSYEKIPPRIVAAYYQNCIGDVELKREWFEPLKNIYEGHGAWSWSGHVVTEKVKMFSLKGIQ